MRSFIASVTSSRRRRSRSMKDVVVIATNECIQAWQTLAIIRLNNLCCIKKEIDIPAVCWAALWNWIHRLVCCAAGSGLTINRRCTELDWTLWFIIYLPGRGRRHRMLCWGRKWNRVVDVLEWVAWWRHLQWWGVWAPLRHVDPRVNRTGRTAGWSLWGRPNIHANLVFSPTPPGASYATATFSHSETCQKNNNKRKKNLINLPLHIGNLISTFIIFETLRSLIYWSTFFFLLAASLKTKGLWHPSWKSFYDGILWQKHTLRERERISG